VEKNDERKFIKKTVEKTVSRISVASIDTKFSGKLFQGAGAVS
jgi:hypothetical protein